MTAILDWSLQERIGFSAFVSLGSMLDVSWGDWIDYLGDDPYTESILICMESIGNPVHFFQRHAVALRKPIIVLKRAGLLPRLRPPLRIRGRWPAATKFWMPRFGESASCGPHRRSLQHGRGLGQAAAAYRTTFDNHDQRRWPRCAGYRCASKARRTTSQLSQHGMVNCLRSDLTEALEPRQPGGHPG